jgi:Ras-related GTP-binding protein C/D
VFKVYYLLISENFRHIQQRVLDELLDISFEYEQVPINFYLTSIHDHSLQDAFSRVLHKLIGSLPYIEELLNVFCGVRPHSPARDLLIVDIIYFNQNSQSSKAFLFDMNSRLYVATDASPVDSATHNLCSDYLQMLNSFGPLYKYVSQ